LASKQEGEDFLQYKNTANIDNEESKPGDRAFGRDLYSE
jgi:hypothetical protein